MAQPTPTSSISVVLAAALAAATIMLVPSPYPVAADGNGAPAGSASEVARNLALGGEHTCMIDGSGDVSCWGGNELGQLGRNDLLPQPTPHDRVTVEMPVDDEAVQVVAGSAHTCAVLEAGQVACWGSNERGQTGMVGLFAPIPPAPLAFPSPEKLVVLPGGAGAVDIGSGIDHTCAVLDTGAISCWGDNQFGQLGVTTAGTNSPPSGPIDFPGGRRAVAVDGGTDHTCALLDDGTVSCWGANDHMQSLGVGTGIAGPTPPQLLLGKRATAIGAADDWSCALLVDAALACWGRPDPIAPATGPSLIDTYGVPVTSFSIGGNTLCYTTDIPTQPSCGGDNFYGQLGVGSSAQWEKLGDGLEISFPDHIATDAVVVGNEHACGITDHGYVACWGRNHEGQLGFDSQIIRALRPAAFVGDPLDGITSLATGSDHACAIVADGQVRCWGADADLVGVPGYDETLPYASTPVALPAGRTAVDVDSFGSTTCALLDNDDVACWGANSYNQAGQPTPPTDVATPTIVPFLSTLTTTQIAVGSNFACALRTDTNGLVDDRIVCWGNNNNGELGTNGNGRLSLQPVQLPAGTTPTAVTAGGNHACARLDDGTAACWGYNGDGQLGDGTTDTDLVGTTRITLPAGNTVSRIDAGGQHTCVKITDGTACFGYNSDGRLGTGDNDDNLDVDEFIGLSVVAIVQQLDAGRDHTCVQTATLFGSPSLYCFGPNGYGQLGQGPLTSTNTIGNPVPLPDSPAGVSLASGITCVRLADTTATCVGDNSDGRMGGGMIDPDGGTTRAAGIRVLETLATVGEIAHPTVATVPGAPTNVQATPGNGRATASWKAAPTGGATITSYVVTATPGGKQCSTTGATACAVTGLTNGTGYTFTVVAINRLGPGAPSAKSASVTPGTQIAPSPDAIAPIDPARYWDSRDEPTFDGMFGNTGRLADGGIHEIQIAGRGAIPADAAGIVANLTVIFPDGPGFATIYPCTDDVPNASTLNYGAGEVIANNTIVPLDGDGNVCVFSLRGADYALDVNGFTPTESPIVGINPARYLETRAGEKTFDGNSLGAGRTGDDAVVEVQIAGRGTIPADATAAIVNATIIAPDGPGFATLYPCGDVPGSSNINYPTGTVTPNGAITQLSDSGTLCLFNLRSADAIIDVSGYVPAGIDTITTRTPNRFLDTRAGEPTVDGKSAGVGRNDAGGVVEVQIAGRAGVPTDATAAMLNLGIIGPDGPGFATLYPCGDVPGTSNLNHTQAGVVLANNAVTRLSTTGAVCVFTLTGADLILDVTGFLR